MAKKQVKNKRIEESLWETADSLRGKVEASEYKHVVLGLFFLKYAGDRFDAQRKKLIADGKKAHLDNVAFYTADSVFYLSEESRWSYIIQNLKQGDLALKVDTALYMIEQKKPQLKGALPDNYYSKLNLDNKLATLISEIDRINTQDQTDLDIMGRIYEYFLLKFSIKEGGEFYTPKAVVKLIAELVQPYDGIIYAPCCGSGGMFVQSIKFIESHNGNRSLPTIIGQEYTTTTYKLAKMNLAIRGINADLGNEASDTFLYDQHPDLKADFIMANPPFNQKKWRTENELRQDVRWAGYEVPPVSDANYGWILHMVSKLNVNGTAGFLLANGALGSDDIEYKIRKCLIENDLVEAIFILPREMFYSTEILVTLWILNRNKKGRSFMRNGKRITHRNRLGETLFVDLRTWGEEFEKKFVTLTELEITKAMQLFHDWQKKGINPIPALCFPAKKEDIIKKDYTLIPSKYISFVDRDSGIDYNKEMSKLQTTFKNILEEERGAQSLLKKAFKGLGYELK